MEIGMTNLGTGGEAGDVSDADKEEAALEAPHTTATGGRPDGGQYSDDDAAADR